MTLLERAPYLQALEAALQQATHGAGQLVLVTGEAGIGKSSLVAAFTEQHSSDARVLVGRCDPIDSPRALGPLLDVAPAIGLDPVTLAARDTADRLPALLAAVTSELTVLTIEDAQWADGATLDFLVFLGRRISEHPVLAIVTFRSAETPPDDPLRVAIGRLGSSSRRTIELPPLTRQGVASLAAQSGIDVDALLDVSGGNPFFVTEVIAAGLQSIPRTVADSILARTVKLPAKARITVELVSVLPRGATIATAELLSDPESIDHCVRAGILTDDGERLRFRHELARRAVEASIAPAARRRLHERVLGALVAEGQGAHDASEFAHHAVGAANLEAVVRWSAEAGSTAAHLGANRAAVNHFSAIVGAGSAAADSERAAALEGLGHALGALGRSAEAVTRFDEAGVLWRSIGQAERSGRAQVYAAGHTWTAGRGPDARERMERVIDELQSVGGATLALGYAQQARLRMLARDIHGAIVAGERAIAIATPLREAETLAMAYNAVGTATWFTEPSRAEQLLQHSLELAQECGSLQLVASALSNQGSAAGEVRHYAAADRSLDAAIAFCQERDLDGTRDYSLAWRSRTHLEQGDLAAAGTLANELLARPISAISRMVALTVIGLVRSRRGDPGADEALERSWVAAKETDDVQRLWPACVALAEAHYWRTGEVGAVEQLEGVLERAHRLNMEWATSDILIWLHRAGIDTRVPVAPSAFAAWRARDFDAAAAQFHEMGAPFDEAMVRLDQGTEESVLQALELYVSLGATAASSFARHKLKRMGVARLPRGPRPSTSQHPAGLTGREAEIARLVADGMSNEAIAESLVLSSRTVEHHVSAVLSKLGATRRRDVADLLASVERGQSG